MGGRHLDSRLGRCWSKGWAVGKTRKRVQIPLAAPRRREPHLGSTRRDEARISRGGSEEPRRRIGRRGIGERLRTPLGFVAAAPDPTPRGISSSAASPWKGGGARASGEEVGQEAFAGLGSAEAEEGDAKLRTTPRPETGHYSLSSFCCCCFCLRHLFSSLFWKSYIFFMRRECTRWWRLGPAGQRRGRGGQVPCTTRRQATPTPVTWRAGPGLGSRGPAPVGPVQVGSWDLRERVGLGGRRGVHRGPGPGDWCRPIASRPSRTLKGYVGCRTWGREGAAREHTV